MPPYDMPEHITEEFVTKLFSYQKGHQLFLPAVASDFSSESRTRLMRACRSIGGDVWAAYRQEALKWAYLTSDTGRWPVDSCFLVYDATLQTPLISRLIVTDRNIRLVLTPTGWHSFAEFLWRYDETISDHIMKYMAQQQVEHEALCHRLQSILTAATSDLVVSTLVVASGNTVGEAACVGLAALPYREWTLPKGVTFIDTVSTAQ
jgi:hypothetical protein